MAKNMLPMKPGSGLARKLIGAIITVALLVLVVRYPADIAGWVTGIVVNGSPTQTMMADRAGARSQFAQLALACAVLLVLVLLSGELAYLPRCVLAAIVFTIAVSMIDGKTLRDIRRESPGEYYLAIATAATVVTLGVEQGILLAIALSLFRHVRHSYRPHTMMFLPDPNGRWEPGPATPPAKSPSPGSSSTNSGRICSTRISTASATRCVRW